MLTRTQIPYISDGPLGEKTRWVGFPVLITAQERTYQAALTSGKRISDQLQSLGRDLPSGRASVVPIEDQVEGQTAVELLQEGKECVVHIYSGLALRFEDGQEMWEKLETVSTCLDVMSEFADSFKGQKRIHIEVGTALGSK